MKDITETCDRLLLLDKGKLLFDGSIQRLREGIRQRPAHRGRTAPAHHGRGKASLEKETSRLGGNLKEAEGIRLVIEHKDEASAPPLIQMLLGRLKVVDLNLEKTDIETIVTRIYRRPGTAPDDHPRPRPPP